MAEQKVANPGRDAHTLCDPATGSAMWGPASTKSPATMVWAFAAGPAEMGLGLRDSAPRGILPVAASTYSSLRHSGQNRLQEWLLVEYIRRRVSGHGVLQYDPTKARLASTDAAVCLWGEQVWEEKWLPRGCSSKVSGQSRWR